LDDDDDTTTTPKDICIYMKKREIAPRTSDGNFKQKDIEKGKSGRERGGKRRLSSSSRRK